MTIEEYRKNPERVAVARQILEQPALQEMLGLILITSPCNSSVDASLSDVASHLLHGMERGHFRFYNLLLSLATHDLPPPLVDDAAMALEPEDNL